MHPLCRCQLDCVDFDMGGGGGHMGRGFPNSTKAGIDEDSPEQNLVKGDGGGGVTMLFLVFIFSPYQKNKEGP